MSNSNTDKMPMYQPFNIQFPKGKGRQRFGKTYRDKVGGCKASNAMNKAARAAWSRGDENVFPFGTCNGKKSRAMRSK